MESTLDSRRSPSDVVSDRDRLLAKARLALFAGYIIGLGERVFAFRARGEVIDDGRDSIVEALGDGLFERMRVHTYDKNGKRDLPPRWSQIYDGANLHRVLSDVIAGLDDDKVKWHLIGFVFAFANAPARHYARLRLGLPISDPPTTVLS